MNQPEHPIWKIAALLALGFVLWLNASHFDYTELTALAEYAVVLAGFEGGKRLLGRKEEKP